MFISLFTLFSLGFLVLSLTVNYFSSRLTKQFSSQHGPPSYPLIGCLISFYQNRYRLLDWYTDLLSQSPTKTIVVHRFGARRTIITANPDNVEYILKTNFNNFPKGQPFTEILGDLLGCGIFNVDGELWRTQRKIASHGFTTKSLREFLIKILEEEVENRLLPILESAIKTNKVLDMQELLKRFALDVVCKVSLGTDPGCLEPSLPISPLAEAFDAAAEISARRGASPLFVIWKIKRALRIGSEGKLKEAIEHVHKSVAEIIQTKKKKKKLAVQGGDHQGDDHEDLLSRLISAGHDEETIRDMVISFIMAGRDTTSAVMTWLFWLLSRHRNVERELVKEVKKKFSITDQNGCDDDKRSSSNYEGLKEMGLLKACLCESMRLYPPVAWDSKHPIINDVLPDGTIVRGGDRVTYFPYGMGRMEELWGKDRFEFKPDRWFVEPDKVEEGEMKNVSPYKFPVFQAGPRVCLGKEMAFIQMKYVVASVLNRFELRPVATEDEPVFVPLLTSYMAGGFKVRVMDRNGNSQI
ncbi:Cytochrome P450 [Macleaya cordata]|uniref:Cytochrome P450 n=1 Tax=Macleaya cordata TaxID=56857 RepID=A0A200QGE7_MACCD|nr:Cytochrome P450 [Macleaya cordata]